MKKLLLTSALLFTSSMAFGYGAAKHLTTESGMSLYTFDKDTKGTSVCYDGCAAKWPPYIVKQGAVAKEGMGMTERKDGSKQWTFKGQPLYTWVGDKKAGDTNGDGVKGVWHLAKKGYGKAQKKESEGY